MSCLETQNHRGDLSSPRPLLFLRIISLAGEGQERAASVGICFTIELKDTACHTLIITTI